MKFSIIVCLLASITLTACSDSGSKTIPRGSLPPTNDGGKKTNPVGNQPQPVPDVVLPDTNQPVEKDGKHIPVPTDPLVNTEVVFTKVPGSANTVVTTPPPPATPSPAPAPAEQVETKPGVDQIRTPFTKTTPDPVATPDVATTPELKVPKETTPALDTAGTESAPAAAVQACSPLYKDENWGPGLPTAPVNAPLYVDFENKAAGGLRYTDARADQLLSFIVDRANGLPDYMQLDSQNFAKLIHELVVVIDANGAVRVGFSYEHSGSIATDPRDHVSLTGTLDPSQARADVVLAQAKAGANKMAGVMTCADLKDGGCRNIVLRIDLYGKKDANKIVASAYALHRWGAAKITMNESDRKDFDKLPSKNYGTFAQYLSESIKNACVSKLTEVNAGTRNVSACEKQNLTAECGTDDIHETAAKSIGLRSWAVAYGRSGFDLTFASDIYSGVLETDKKLTSQFEVNGALVRKDSGKMDPFPMNFVGPNILKGAELVNNDGGGNLSVRLKFVDQTKETPLVFNVSALLPSSTYLQNVNASVAQMPALAKELTTKADEADLK